MPRGRVLAGALVLSASARAGEPATDVLERALKSRREPAARLQRSGGLGARLRF